MPRSSLDTFRGYAWLKSNPMAPHLLQQYLRKLGILNMWQLLVPQAGLHGLCWIIVSSSGLVSVGVGDAFAATVGRLWGRHKIGEENPKTWEGLVAAIVSMLMATAGFTTLCFVQGSLGPWSVCEIIAVIILVAVLEASSQQMDNLVLPVFHCTAMLLLVAWWLKPDRAPLEGDATSVTPNAMKTEAWAAAISQIRATL